MKYIFTLSILLFTLGVQAQLVTGIATYWDDSFKEWQIFTEDEDIQGTLQPRWISRDDWSEWEWELADEQVSIKQAWRNDPTQWQIRSYDGDIVTCRAMWRNDLSKWKITNNSVSITLRPRWANNPNEWIVREKNYGQFTIYTNRENDPRDWHIQDELSEQITPNMKIALVFLAIYHSFPKE